MRIPLLLSLTLLLVFPAAPLRAQEETAPPPQPPAQPAPQPTPTLGEFALRLAAGLGLAAPAAGWTRESAAWALVGKGVTLKGDLAAPLTEADAVAALTGLGYRIRTTTPSRVVSRDRLDVLLEVFLTPAAPAK